MIRICPTLFSTDIILTNVLALRYETDSYSEDAVGRFWLMPDELKIAERKTSDEKQGWYFTDHHWYFVSIRMHAGIPEGLTQPGYCLRGPE